MLYRLSFTSIALLSAVLVACGGDGDNDQDEIEGKASPSAVACNTDESSTREAFQRLRPSVVFISVTTPEGPGIATGFVLDEGEVLTAAHVVANVESVEIEFDGGEVAEADVRGILLDEARDIAFVPVTTGDTPPASIGASETGLTGCRSPFLSTRATAAGR